MPDVEKLRQLAAWYREFAERAGNPTVWEWRLRTAEDLESEAKRMSTLPDSSRTDASPRLPGKLFH